MADEISRNTISELMLLFNKINSAEETIKEMGRVPYESAIALYEMFDKAKKVEKLCLDDKLWGKF